MYYDLRTQLTANVILDNCKILLYYVYMYAAKATYLCYTYICSYASVATCMVVATVGATVYINTWIFQY